jgi:hypothetical protein
LPLHLLKATLAGLAIATAAPAIAHADSLSLSTSPDPAEDRPVTIYANTVSTGDSRLYVVSRNAGGAPCGATYRADAGGDDKIYGERVQGARQVITTSTFSEPGDYLLCGWVQGTPSSTIATAASSAIVTVRQNAAAVALTVPATAANDQPMSWSASVTTELARDLFVAARPARQPGDSSACGQSYNSKVGSFVDLAYGRAVQGAQSVADVLSASSLDDHTLYLVCAWVQEGTGDPIAEAQTAAYVQVGVPAACARARNANRRALKAQRRAQQQARRAHGSRLKRARRPVTVAREHLAQTQAAQQAACGA